MVTDALYHIHVTKKVHTAISYLIFTSARSAEICKDIPIYFFNSRYVHIEKKYLLKIFSDMQKVVNERQIDLKAFALR